MRLKFSDACYALCAVPAACALPLVSTINANTCANQAVIHVAVAHAVQRKDPYHSHLSVREKYTTVLL